MKLGQSEDIGIVFSKSRLEIPFLKQLNNCCITWSIFSHIYNINVLFTIKTYSISFISLSQYYNLVTITKYQKKVDLLSFLIYLFLICCSTKNNFKKRYLSFIPHTKNMYAHFFNTSFTNMSMQCLDKVCRQ